MDAIVNAEVNSLDSAKADGCQNKDNNETVEMNNNIIYSKGVKKECKSDLMEILYSLPNDSSTLNIKLLLKSVYDCCHINEEFNDNEKLFIGTTIKRHLVPIFKFLSFFAFALKPYEISSALIFRSSIEFVTEIFHDFPVANEQEKLGSYWSSFLKSSAVLDVLDKKLSYIQQNYYQDGLYLDNEYDGKPDGIPQDHHWWF